MSREVEALFAKASLTLSGRYGNVGTVVVGSAAATQKMSMPDTCPILDGRVGILHEGTNDRDLS